MTVAIRAITRIQDADDAPALGAGQDDHALTWDNTSNAFVMAEFDAAGTAAALVEDLSGVTSEPAAAALTKMGLEGMPLAPVRKVTIVESDVLIMDYIGERLYGFGDPTPGLLVYSDDYGETWATLQNTGTADYLRGIRARTDGEVLLCASGGVWVSSGWATNPAAATWTKTLSPSSGASFLRWAVDVYQDRVIVSEYAVSPRDPARYMWISEDGGDNFTVALDLLTLFPGNAAGYHWHGVCIDPYVSGGRFWAWAGDDTHEAYWSDDGTTWTNITSAIGNVTTLTPTVHGMVLGTDSNQPQGLFRIVRTDDPADMVVEEMYDVRSIQNTFGFSLAAMANPRTGHAYVTLKSDFASTPGYILASPDGLFGQEIYAIDGAANIQNIAVNAAGTKVSVSYAKSGQKILIFDAPRFGVYLERYDDGGIAGGVAGSAGIAVGQQSAAPGYGVAIGPSANAVSRSVAIGRGVVAPDLCTVIGSGASVNATWNNYNVIVGEGAKGAEQTVVIGARAEAIATGAAIGYLAKSAHSASIAVGNSTNTNATNQVAIGARDLEIQSSGVRGLILRDTNGARYRVTVSTAGALVVTAL